MVEVNGLSKDELIANLWLTDEMINEIEIVKREIDKKKASLDSTIAATEQEHLKAVETKYYDSSEYKAHQDYNGLIEKLKDFKGVAILMNEEFLNIFRKEMEEIAENVVKKYIKQNNYE